MGFLQQPVALHFRIEPRSFEQRAALAVQGLGCGQRCIASGLRLGLAFVGIR
jgi:hypothetical protein